MGRHPELDGPFLAPPHLRCQSPQECLTAALREQLAHAHGLRQRDAAEQRGGVEMPHALERKVPRAGNRWAGFWVFPQDPHATDPRSGVVRRHCLYDQTFQRAFKRAVQVAGIPKPATPHTEPGHRAS